jgi:hypothetical protein
MTDLNQPAMNMPPPNGQGQLPQPPPVGQIQVATGGGAPPAAASQGQAIQGGGAQPNMHAGLPRTKHRTFASLYSDPNCDPAWDSAVQIMQRFDPMKVGPLNSADLLATVSGDPTRPSTYLCCAQLHDTPRIYLIHMLSRYPPSLDGRVTPWDNRLCAYLGDLVQDQPINVLLPDNIFEILPQLYMYDEETLAQELPNMVNGTLFPRGCAQNGNVIQIAIRPVTYLPTKYAPLLISNRGYTPQEVWGLLLPRLQQDNMLADAAPIVAWLRATLHATPPNNGNPPATTITITAPFMDHNLNAHRSQIRILTGLGSLSTGVETSLTAVANVLVAHSAEARTARLVNEMERDQPVLPSAKFNMLFASLKSMLNVQEENTLPEFWFTLAAAPKKQEFSTVRDFLDNYSRSANAFLAVAPIPTPKLLTDLTSVTFVADNDDDLKTSIQPFVAMDGSAAYRQATQEMARAYTVLAERDVSLSFSDWDNFKIPKDLRSFPTSFFESEQNLGVFGNLIGAVLGEQHPITAAYRPFWTAFCRRFRTRLHDEIDEHRIIKPVHILCHIQLLCFNWFHAKKDGLQPEAPNFLKLLEKISLSIYTLPTLPLPLYQLINPRPQPNPTIAGAGTVTDDSTTVSGSTVSTLTNQTTPTGPTQLTVRTRTPVTNPAQDATLQALLPTTVCIRDLLGPDDAPKNAAGAAHCLAYHL